MFSSIVQALIRIADAVTKLVGEAQKANAKLERIADSQQDLAATQQQLVDLVSRLFPGPVAAIRLVFHTKGETQMGDIIVKDDETTLRWTVTPVDAEGQPTTLPDGFVPSYETSDESVAALHPADDGLSGTIDVGSPGDATVTGHFGTDNAGNELVGIGTVHVTPGDVNAVGIDFATG